MRKADGQKWRLVHDLRAVNNVVQDRVAKVPNPHILLTNVPSTAKWCTVIDFFSVPLAQQSQELFAVSFENQSYTYTRMPQGFKHSPHVFNQVLKDDLQGVDLQSVVLQYVDDLLLCTESREQSVKLLEKTGKRGAQSVPEKATILPTGGGIPRKAEGKSPTAGI